MITDCLAATGLDASVPLVLGAVLLLVGAGVAVVAFRRGSAGAALLIALVLVVVPLSFSGVPSSATAADDCGTQGQSAPSVVAPTPSPAVEPVEECAPVTEDDVVVQATTSTFTYADNLGRLTVSQDDAEAYLEAYAAVAAHDDVQTSSAVDVYSAGSPRTLLRTVQITPTATEQFSFTIPQAEMDAIVGTESQVIIDLHAVISYDDGCGAQTSSDVHFEILRTGGPRIPSQPFPF